MGVLNSVTDWLGLSSPHAPNTTTPGEGVAGWTNAQDAGHASSLYGGMGYDAGNGNVVDPNTFGAVNGPNMSQLGALESLNSLQDRQGQQGALQALGGTMGGQQDLLGQLRQLYANPNSSMANMQLQQGLGQAQAQQQSMAAGANGNNAALAMRAAAQNGAGLAADANNRAAQLRLEEQNASLHEQGSILNSLAGEQGGEASMLGTQYLGGQAGASGNAQTGANNELQNQLARNGVISGLMSGGGQAAAGAGKLAAGG